MPVLTKTAAADRPVLPLIMGPDGVIAEGFDWVARNLAGIRGKLTDHGAVLLRGLPVRNAADFETVYASVLGQPLPYVERSSPRLNVSNNVYTSTEYPANRSIFLHNEQSYNSVFSRYIGFYCEVVAEREGQTPIADVRRVLERIDPDVRSEFQRRGYVYRRVFGSGMGPSWQEAYRTESPAELERYCAANGIGFTWLSADKSRLQTRQRRQVVARHPQSGVLSWFNHMTFFHHSSLEPDLRELIEEVCDPEDYPNATMYGDGGVIPDATVAHLREAYLAEETVFDWAAGDVLLVDNMLVAHGRRPFVGPRRVLVAMSTPEAWAKVSVTAPA